MKKKLKGVTLIEVLVAAAIAAFILTGAAMFLIQNARLSALFQNRCDAYTKLNLFSRTLEMSIKRNAKVDVDINNGKWIKIYKSDGTFDSGYILNSDKKLCRLDANGNNTGEVAGLFSDCVFETCKFKMDNQIYAFFEAKIKVLDKNNKERFTTENYEFFAKCRSY